MKKESLEKLATKKVIKLLEKGREYRQALHYTRAPDDFPQFYRPKYRLFPKFR